MQIHNLEREWKRKNSKTVKRQFSQFEKFDGIIRRVFFFSFAHLCVRFFTVSRLSNFSVLLLLIWINCSHVKLWKGLINVTLNKSASQFSLFFMALSFSSFFFMLSFYSYLGSTLNVMSLSSLLVFLSFFFG